MTVTIPEHAQEAAAAMLAAKRAAETATEELEARRDELGAAILAARDAGLTVPQVSDLLGWSEANTFRVSAQAKAKSNTR